MNASDGMVMSCKKQKPLKGIKVISLDQKKKVGVAAASLGDLINKACARLKVSRKGVKISLPDGTLVDSGYFDTLDNQITVVLLRDGETLHPTAIVRFVTSLLDSWRGPELQEGVRALLARPGAAAALLPPPAGAGPDRTRLSRRQDDPDWFKDLDTAAATKEEYMRRRCEARVRGYFYKSRDQLRAAPAAAQPVLAPVLEAWLRQLRADRFHGHRFDRGCDGRLCDAAGTFTCQGEFSAERCPYAEHTVNPYTSRETRIVFSTWNLDHRIERSRTILPTLVSAAQSAGPRRRVNSAYFYRLLFTTDNLRLVHVVCHDKGSHDRFTCDQTQVFVR